MTGPGRRDALDRILQDATVASRKRLRALRELVALRSETDVLPDLTAALASPHNRDILKYVVRSFGYLRSRPAFDAVRPYLDHASAGVASSAIKSILEIDAAQALAPIEALIRGPDPARAKLAARFLAERGGRAGRDALARMLSGRDPEERIGALLGLRYLGDAECVAHLSDLLRRERDPVVLGAARLLLLRLAREADVQRLRTLRKELLVKVHLVEEVLGAAGLLAESALRPRDDLELPRMPAAVEEIVTATAGDGDHPLDTVLEADPGDPAGGPDLSLAASDELRMAAGVRPVRPVPAGSDPADPADPADPGDSRMPADGEDVDEAPDGLAASDPPSPDGSGTSVTPGADPPAELPWQRKQRRLRTRKEEAAAPAGAAGRAAATPAVGLLRRALSSPTVLTSLVTLLVLYTGFLVSQRASRVVSVRPPPQEIEDHPLGRVGQSVTLEGVLTRVHPSYNILLVTVDPDYVGSVYFLDLDVQAFRVGEPIRVRGTIQEFRSPKVLVMKGEEAIQPGVAARPAAG